jgi:GMP synthase (glutamine-hydrolysing)
VATPAQVLVVQHEAEAPPGWLGEWLTAAGLELDVILPFAGQPLPGSLSRHAALVVLGGAMGAYDDASHPWLTQTKQLLREAVETDVATFGICLGHQLACVALGGSVAPHPHGRQVGVLPIRWKAEAADDPLFAPVNPAARGLQWNNDVVVGLPSGAVLMAGTPDGGPQVVRLAARAWGVQFHPEVDQALVERWAKSDEREGDDRDQDIDAALRELGKAEPELEATWRPVADRFARLVQSG